MRSDRSDDGGLGRAMRRGRRAGRRGRALAGGGPVGAITSAAERPSAPRAAAGGGVAAGAAGCGTMGMTSDVRRSGLVLLTLLVFAGGAAARDRATIKVRTPKVTLAAGSNVEICYFLRIPTTTPFVMASWQLVNKGAK